MRLRCVLEAARMRREVPSVPARQVEGGAHVPPGRAARHSGSGHARLSEFAPIPGAAWG